MRAAVGAGGLGNRDRQDAVSEVGMHAVWIDGQGKSERSGKLSLASFELLVPFRTAALRRPLPAHGHALLVGVDLDVLTPQPGQLDREDVGVGPFAQIDRRDPSRRRPAEQTFEALLHREQVARRIPRHGSENSDTGRKGQRAS